MAASSALLYAGMADAAIGGTIAFAKELDSPYLREPSAAVAELTGRAPESVRDLLLENAAQIRAAAN